jgi:hypothetical protein
MPDEPSEDRGTAATLVVIVSVLVVIAPPFW